MDEGSSAEIVLLLGPSAGMGNDDKRDAGEGEIVSGFRGRFCFDFR